MADTIAIGSLPTGTPTTDDYLVFVDNADNTTKKSPMSSLPTGSGDMLKSVYDPANGIRQVAFDDSVMHDTGDETVTGSKTMEQIKFVDPAKSAIEFSHTGDGGGSLWSYYNIGGWTGTELYNNAKYDGTNWVRFDVSKPATSVFQDENGNIQFWKSEPAANPITNWVMTREIDKNGVETLFQATTPSNPSSGYNKIYFKTGDRLYTKSSGGTEVGILTQADNVRYFDIYAIEKATDNAVGTNIAGAIECPFTGTITEIGAYVETAGTTGASVWDVNKNGTTIMTTNKLSIDSGEVSTRTAATAPTLTTTAITAGDLITIDTDSLSTTKPKGLHVRIGIRLT